MSPASSISRSRTCQVTRRMPTSSLPCLKATASCSRTYSTACSTSLGPRQQPASFEEAFLAGVAKRFGFTDKEFAAIKARQALAEKRNPYHALGVNPDISNEALTSH